MKFPLYDLAGSAFPSLSTFIGSKIIELGDISKLEIKKSLSAANVLHPSSLLRL